MCAHAQQESVTLADEIAIREYMSQTVGVSERQFTVEPRQSKEGYRVYRIRVDLGQSDGERAGQVFDVNIDDRDGRVVSESPAN